MAIKNKKYLLTDSCHYYESSKQRSTHFIEVCDLETGEIKHLRNGTIIQIIKGKTENPT